MLQILLENAYLTELNKLILSNVQKNKIVSITNVSLDSVINEFYKIVAPNMAACLRAQYEKSKSTPFYLKQILSRVNFM